MARVRVLRKKTARPVFIEFWSERQSRFRRFAKAELPRDLRRSLSYSKRPISLLIFDQIAPGVVVVPSGEKMAKSYWSLMQKILKNDRAALWLWIGFAALFLGAFVILTTEVREAAQGQPELIGVIDKIPAQYLEKIRGPKRVH